MSGRPGLRDALHDGVVVLDGGLATELERRGHDLSDDLWSARLLRDDPGEVLATHAAYFAAGARVATSASYQASFEGFAAAGLDRVEAERLLRQSVRLAVQARDSAEDDGVARWVAASVGPYGAVLADGSEYRGDYGLSVDALREFHRPRLEILADAGADVLACETVPCLAEAEALVAEVDRLGVPAWLSLTCAGLRTRAGEPVQEAFALAASSPNVLAVGVNCTAPDDVAGLVAVAAGTGLPVVVYPNSGEGWDGQARSWTGDPRFAPGQVRSWVGAGARLVGGCCRVGPAEISALSYALSE
ncbi:MAG: homocysteine S-methyltransferase [Motilibacteraceae bacterium]